MQVLLFDYHDCYFAKIYSDYDFNIIFKKKSNVPPKIRAGGQSAARFGRVRQEEIKKWFKKLNSLITSVEGTFHVGTSSIYYKQFYDILDTYNQQKIISRINSEYSDLSGVYQMINKLREKNEK